MRVLSMSFNSEHKEMLGNTKVLMEKGLVVAHPRFSKLITSLRTAIDFVPTFQYNNMLIYFPL